MRVIPFRGSVFRSLRRVLSTEDLLGENDAIYIHHLSVGFSTLHLSCSLLGKSLSLFDLFLVTMVHSHIRVTPPVRRVSRRRNLAQRWDCC